MRKPDIINFEIMNNEKSKLIKQKLLNLCYATDSIDFYYSATCEQYMLFVDSDEIEKKYLDEIHEIFTDCEILGEFFESDKISTDYSFFKKIKN